MVRTNLSLTKLEFRREVHMQKLAMVLTATLVAAGTLGIAAILFCAGAYAEGSRGGTWRAWTSADDREER